MSRHTVYVPHHSGAVLGSQYHQPWLALTAWQATGAWRGQPVFLDVVSAFGWLDVVRAGRLAAVRLGMAKVDAEGYTDPRGLIRLRLERNALLEPHRQVLRSDVHSDGPDPGVLAAYRHTVQERAYHRWTAGAGRGTSMPDRVADAVRALWEQAYPLAYVDARTVVAGRIAGPARLLHNDERKVWWETTRAGFGGLLSTATAVVDDSEPVAVPTVPLVLSEYATSRCTDLTAARQWQSVSDRVWQTALRTAAADGVLGAATALTNAWATRYATGLPPDPLDPTGMGDEAAITGWLRRHLAESNQSVQDQWRDATASPTGQTMAPARRQTQPHTPQWSASAAITARRNGRTR